MTVLLRRSCEVLPAAAFDRWFVAASVLDRQSAADFLPVAKKLSNLGSRLEAAFDAVCSEWWRTAKALANGPDAELSSAVTCAGYGSDFGLMMAWGHLVGELAAEPARTLVVCNDPWLFRHLAAIAGVDAGAASPLWPAAIRLATRGHAARLALACRLACSALATRRQRAYFSAGDAVILVYGHPRSDAYGHDDYFGTMMKEFPGLKRALHTDCGVKQARLLAGDGRTASLHAWGRAGWTPGLLFVHWRPEPKDLRGSCGWLVRRAAAVEGSGAAHAINVWQRLCQEAWLADAKPAVVAWPWENHGWERALCRAARRLGVKTVGYQHTVIGRHQLNYSPVANLGGEASLPDVIVCDGPAYRDQLVSWGVPAARLEIGGSLRIRRAVGSVFDPKGPVFAALSARRSIARAQMQAVERAASEGFSFVVRDHPMYPLAFRESDRVRRADRPLAAQKGLAAVFYATGASGLEALLAGLPTFRLLPEDEIAVDVLPPFAAAEAVAGDGLAAALRRVKKPAPLAWERVLADVDWPLWRRLLVGDGTVPAAAPGRRERIA